MGQSVVLAVYGRARSARAPIGRDSALDELAARGIDARPLWTPLHQTRLYAEAPRLGGSIADAIFAAAVSLPSSSNLDPADQARVVAVLRDTLSPPRVSASRASAR